MPPRADEAAEFVVKPTDNAGRGALEMDSGEKRLVELGYKQELSRKVSFWGTFGLSFSILSVLVGPNTLYGVGFTNGGPVAIIWGWAGVSLMTTIVCLSMCEIASAYPTAGGLYFWADHLIPESQKCYKPIASWITGWCNVIGQITSAASVFFSTAQVLLVMITMCTGGANGGGYIPTPGVFVAVALGLYVISGVVNTCTIQVQSYINIFATILNVVVALFIIIAIPLMATSTQSASFVFTEYINGSNGVSSPVYVYLLGLLMAQYTLSGYDGAFHVAEETKGADWNTPVSLIMALIITEILGFIYLIAITFSIYDSTDLFSPDTITGGVFPVAQIFWDVFEARFNHGGGSIVILSCVAAAIWLCGNSILTSNARMVYAFSRDGAIPGSYFWHKVASNKVPIFAVWGSLILGMCFIVPYIGSAVAYNAVSSIATVALYLAYGIPIFLRTFVAGKHFTPGPFHLGRWSFFNGLISILWILFITAIFVMPNSYPVTSKNLNYAGIALAAWLGLVMIYWFASAQFWFTGPRSNMSLEEKKEFYGME